MSFISRTLFTNGDHCEKTTYGPLHGSSFALGQSSPGTVCTRVLPFQVGTLDTTLVHCYFLLVCLHARSGFGVRAQEQFANCPARLCELLGVCCSSLTRNAENCIDWESRLSTDHYEKGVS